MRPDPRYEVIIYWSHEDRAFVAEVPELPGCASDGPAALANVKVTRTAAFPPSRLSYHGVAGHATEPWSVRPHEASEATT